MSLLIFPLNAATDKTTTTPAYKQTIIRYPPKLANVASAVFKATLLIDTAGWKGKTLATVFRAVPGSMRIHAPLRKPDKVISIEQTPGAALSLNMLPKRMPKPTNMIIAGIVEIIASALPVRLSGVPTIYPIIMAVR